MAIRPINIIEGCAGGGMLGVGVAVALRRIGFQPQTICYIEREAYAASALVARMEEATLDSAPAWDDLATFDGEPWRGIVDCFIAGIPCQGNSLAGKRMLGDDDRNLWPATRRLLRQLQPRLCFIENVYGFLVPDADEGREAPILRVLEDLAEDGWDAEWCVLPASAVGAMHERKRVFLLAHRNDDGQQEGWGYLLERKRNTELRDGDIPPAGVPQGNASGIICDGPFGTGWLIVLMGEAGPELSGRAGGELPGNVEHAERTESGSGEEDIEGGSREWRGGHSNTGRGIPVFAPARNDYWEWLRVLRTDPTLVPAFRRQDRSRVSGGAEESQSEVRGVLDGMAERVGDRADELRLCGNGVVWQCAADAFYQLWNRLMETSHGR